MTSFIFCISFIILCVLASQRTAAASPNRTQTDRFFVFSEEKGPPIRPTRVATDGFASTQRAPNGIDDDLMLVNRRRMPKRQASPNPPMIVVTDVTKDDVMQTKAPTTPTTTTPTTTTPITTTPTTTITTTTDDGSSTTCDTEETTTPTTTTTTPSTTTSTTTTTTTTTSRPPSIIPPKPTRITSRPTTTGETPVTTHSHDSSGGGLWIYALVGTICILCCCLLLLLGLFFFLRWKKKGAHGKDKNKAPAPVIANNNFEADVERYPEEGGEFAEKVEWRPYHIQPEQFKYKGAVTLHNAMAGPKKHKQDDCKSQSIKGNIQWDDNANEAYEIGSKVETIVDVAPEEEMSTMLSKSEQIEQQGDAYPQGMADGSSNATGKSTKSRKKNKSGGKIKPKRPRGPRKKAASTSQTQ